MSAATAELLAEEPGAFLVQATVVAAARRGDVDAFEQLVHRYQREMFRLAFRLLGDRGEAEDAVQDIFVLVWRRLPTLADPRAFHVWSRQLGTRCCLDLLRARSRRPSEVGLPAEEPDGRDEVCGSRSPGPEDVVQTAGGLAGLQQLVAALPPEQRACWVLRELHHLTYPEIADAVGAPVSTVRGRLARARRSLAEGMTAWR
ncbi:RNA polymerase sigma factor [Microlunatus capsulatus]|uniref:RNA polymerase sigma-70 factor (ECF subfamily) n=1 Tax=Microlunatus capsulatus TaxID=99117 RepID=A0ABS4Z2Z2_9ACTN|nr:sigma-70 family RNA polymerase sigma factor [Microlunatus capsulatus]MBP2415354.1 RNA polymerase sigma-70 factor (ECF subfamily) [Microlunatus capsulatus]